MDKKAENRGLTHIEKDTTDRDTAEKKSQKSDINSEIDIEKRLKIILKWKRMLVHYGDVPPIDTARTVIGVGRWATHGSKSDLKTSSSKEIRQNTQKESKTNIKELTVSSQETKSVVTTTTTVVKTEAHKISRE